MTELGIQATQALGAHGEPCRGCAAPLAADQRYCLNCGRRRGEPRVEFREHLPAPSGAPRHEAQPAAQAPAAERPARDYGPLAAVGGIAVLGLMLLVGVLIGKGNGQEAQAPAPIVRVTGDGGAGTTASADAGGAGGNASKKANGKTKKHGSRLAGAGKTAPAVTASDDDLEALQQQSPEDYQRASARLPDTIATPGAAPPVDRKAPGGGSGGGAVIK